MNLEENIQKYIKIEDEIKKRLIELHKLREYKTSITSLIIADLDKEKNKENKQNKENKENKEKGHYTYVSRINGNIKIKMVELKTFNPLTFTFLKKCLLEIIPKAHQVDQIIEYVKTNRESKIISDIKRIN